MYRKVHKEYLQMYTNILIVKWYKAFKNNSIFKFMVIKEPRNIFHIW